MELARAMGTSVEERKRKILQAKQEDIITNKQAQALLAKIEGKTLSSKNRTYIYSLKQIIERGEKNAERVRALRSLLLFLGISPEIQDTKTPITDRLCFSCGTQILYGIQNLYRKGQNFILILEDIPVFDCPNCDDFYLANDSLKLEDELLGAITQEVAAIHEQSFEEPSDSRPCPLCRYKYLTSGETEVYRFKRHQFHLILRRVPVPLYCPQCGYESLDEKTTQAINALLTLISNKLPELRQSGWRKRVK